MKKIGIVGGVAWRSTVDYYRGICRACEELHRARGLRGEVSFPEITIESLDLSRAVAWLGRVDDDSSWHQFDRYHRAALKRLEAAGCDFAMMASNTPHHRLPFIAKGISIPVIDLFEAAARECARMGAAQALCLGTRITMTSPRFRDEFAKLGIQARSPADEDLRRRVFELIEKLQRGEDGIDETGEETKKEYDPAHEIESIVSTSLDDCGLNPDAAVCLACTELTLAFPQFKQRGSFERNGVRYINTMAVHIQAAVEYCLAD